MNLLVVEDDGSIAKLIASGLSKFGHDATTAANGEAALASLRSQEFDAVVLDRMLPGMDGMEVLRCIRHDAEGPPVLMLSALGDTGHRIEGIEAGADDYLIKPFDMQELHARLVAIVRRLDRASSSERLVMRGIQLSVPHQKASRDGRSLNLNKKEFGLLFELMRNSGQVVTRRMLVERVWGEGFDRSASIIESNMSRLRTKLTRFGDPDPIETVRGSGYVIHPSLA